MSRLVAPALLFAAAGCAGTAPPPGDAPLVGEDFKRKAAPSLTFEDQRELGGSSLLVESEKCREELEQLRSRGAEIEDQLRLKDKELQKAREELTASAREREDLRRLLDESLGKERSLTEQAASAEIERLRTERQLTELKLASLVRDGK